MGEKLTMLKYQANEQRKMDNRPSLYHSEMEAYGYLQLDYACIDSTAEEVEKALDTMFTRVGCGLLAGVQLEKIKTNLELLYIHTIEMYADIQKALESEEHYD